MFEWTLQQQQWFKNGACVNYKRQDHFARDCRRKGLKLVINRLRGTKTPQDTKELKGTRGCAVKHFAFCYNDRYPVHEKAKYGASY